MFGTKDLYAARRLGIKPRVAAMPTTGPSPTVPGEMPVPAQEGQFPPPQQPDASGYTAGASDIPDMDVRGNPVAPGQQTPEEIEAQLSAAESKQAKMGLIATGIQQAASAIGDGMQSETTYTEGNPSAANGMGTLFGNTRTSPVGSIPRKQRYNMATHSFDQIG